MDKPEMESPRSVKFFTSEFQKKNINFTFEKPSLIGSPQIQSYQIQYIVYRFSVLFFWAAIFIYDLATSESRAKLSVFLSKWNYTHVLFSAILQSMSAEFLRLREGKVDETTTLYQFCWMIYTIAANTAPCLTILYWIVIYPKSGASLDFFNIASNLGNSVYILLDIMICGMPIRILHCYLPMVYLLAYALFFVVYWVVTDDDVFKMFDLSNDYLMLVTLFVGMPLVAVPAIQVVLFLLYWLRVLVYSMEFFERHRGRVGPWKEPSDVDVISLKSNMMASRPSMNTYDETHSRFTLISGNMTSSTGELIAVNKSPSF